MMSELALPSEEPSVRTAALPASRAANLASPTKTVPMWQGITPRWLLQFLPWVEVKAGIYRVNRVADPTEARSGHEEGVRLPATYADYDEIPEEIHLATVETTVNVHTRVADLYSIPHDQTHEQIRLAVASIKEEKERRAINDPGFGLLAVAERDPRQVVDAGGPPTPDALDDLLSRVWKWPAFFVAHPGAIAAFGCEANARSIKLDTVEIFGVPFVTWRGVPILPSNKIPFGPIDVKQYGYTSGYGEVAATTPSDAREDREDGGGGGGTASSILLMRVGEEVQGVIGLHQAGIGTKDLQSLTVRKMGITREGIESYLITCYFAVAALAPDAVGVLKVRI
jgi:hypothetical protein